MTSYLGERMRKNMKEYVLEIIHRIKSID